MKTLISIIILCFFTIPTSASDLDDVKKTIENYASYDNNFDANGLENITDESFHFIMHAPGETETVQTITRDAFLKGIAAKQFGGNNKILKIEKVDVQGNIANVYFTHKGKGAGFHHFMNLVKLNGKWKAAATAAHIEFYE